MSVLDELASALGRNDEQPNVELAEKLAASGDKAAIAELVGALGDKSALANDAIKTLYEIAERKRAGGLVLRADGLHIGQFHFAFIAREQADLLDLIREQPRVRAHPV